MNQESFDLTHPISHRNDPQTSKEVEQKISTNGKRKSNNQRVAWLVARYPGKTPSDLEALCIQHLFDRTQRNPLGDTPDKRLFEIRRRLSDMNGIHVRRGEKHEARMGLLKNKESVWWPK